MWLEWQGRVQGLYGQKKAINLKQRRLVTVESTIGGAILLLYRLERACRTQLDAEAAGERRLVNECVTRKSGRDVNRFMESASDYGELEFAALLRKIDRIDDSYRH